MFGLLGSGRSELLEGLYGIRGRTVGNVTLLGAEFKPRSATKSLSRGLALVPAERGRQGILSSMTALDNVLLPFFTKLARGWFRNRAREKASFEASPARLSLKPPTPRALRGRTPAGTSRSSSSDDGSRTRERAGCCYSTIPRRESTSARAADLYELVRRIRRATGPRRAVHVV